MNKICEKSILNTLNNVFNFSEEPGPYKIMFYSLKDLFI